MTADFPEERFCAQTASTYCDKVADGTHDSPKEVPNGRPLVTSKHLKNGQILVSEAYHISQDDFDAVNKRSKVDPYDIIFSMIGTIGEIAQVKPEYPEFAIKNVGLFKVADKSRSDWLKYYLMSPQGKSEVEQRKKGTTQQYVSLTDLRALPIPVPKDTVWQEQVLNILRSLDGMIENLQSQNTTLEALAQTIFKSWFVNFDPVHARAAGQTPEGMSPELAELFPSEFVESELGMIPRGWRVSTIGDLCHVIDCLHAKKPALLEHGKPFIQLNCIGTDLSVLKVDQVAKISEADYQKWISRIEVKEGDSVVTNVGRVGAIAQIPFGFNGAIGRNMTAIRPRQVSNFPTFIIQALTSQSMRSEIEYNTDVGSILNALNVRSIPKLRLVSAPNDILTKFESLARPLRAQMETNCYLSIALRELRDELLPRLISGKLRIEEAEEAVAEVLGSTDEEEKAA